ncbi:DUF4465 domain-containing protein [Luteolibacter algae]|uniref:DUF4465 domain-containing protein n=1 Tax=Luteolibacter algae TaxID=454151 RepID=A0ABW5D9K3_9BACT
MKLHNTTRLIAAGAIFCSATSLSFTGKLSAAVLDFESVPLGGMNGPTGVWNGQSGGGALTIDGVTFSNSFTDAGSYTFWSGFVFSNHTDTVTPGFGNQYSTFAGAGGLGSSNFAIGYTNASITFDRADLAGSSALITNTTYAGLSMKEGDGFAKKFGGGSGNDADFFKLIISGYDGGVATGRNVEVYLADFRFADNSLDFILDDWKEVDLGGLGVADEIRFSYDSSDIGQFGINTPSYFALDNLTLVPEPSLFSMSLITTLGLLGIRRRS